jgi:hypothetical protein
MTTKAPTSTTRVTGEAKSRSPKTMKPKVIATMTLTMLTIGIVTESRVDWKARWLSSTAARPTRTNAQKGQSVAISHHLDVASARTTLANPATRPNRMPAAAAYNRPRRSALRARRAATTALPTSSAATSRHQAASVRVGRAGALVCTTTMKAARPSQVTTHQAIVARGGSRRSRAPRAKTPKTRPLTMIGCTSASMAPFRA